jgi:hypothetical protein
MEDNQGRVCRPGVKLPSGGRLVSMFEKPLDRASYPQVLHRQRLEGGNELNVIVGQKLI